MSVSIRTTMPLVRTELYATEAEGQRVLEEMLDLYRQRGNAIRFDGMVYIVTDDSGNLMQTAEMLSS
jgi:hypothetical protein